MTTDTHLFVITKPTERIELTASGVYRVELIQPQAHVDIVGSFAVENTDHLDIELHIVHKSPHTSAKTTLKGVARDSAQIRFFGRIMIDPKCPDTQSFLEERILLLSDKAKAEAVPELEILSDDVRCSHAASVSRIPREHLFYLQSRGLSTTVAEELIADGFLQLPK